MTLRRNLLDDLLTLWEPKYLTGKIVDVGGKKVGKRGKWSPSESDTATWIYLNIDPLTSPDILAPAEKTDLPDQSFDSFLLSEVLEHVEHPEAVLRELHRLTKPLGFGIVTMPFLNQVHADPADFQRWTSSQLRRKLQESGFEIVTIVPMGGVFAVVFDLLLAGASRSIALNHHLALARTCAVLLKLTQSFWVKLDVFATPLNEWITTGWGVVVRVGKGGSRIFGDEVSQTESIPKT